MEAASRTGAHACWLSGAGPTVLALTSGRVGDVFTQNEGERKDRAIADAMRTAAAECGVTGRVFLTQPALSGASVVRFSPDDSTDKLVVWR